MTVCKPLILYSLNLSQTTIKIMLCWSMLIGYSRVSTADQNPDLQRDALKTAECERIYEDVISGAKETRTGLADALAALQSGDTLIVWRLDRLGGSLAHLVST